MLQSVSKQNINAFVAIYAVMGRDLAVKVDAAEHVCGSSHAQTLFVRKPSFTNSRFLAGERRGQSCVFMNMCIHSFRGSVIRTLWSNFSVEFCASLFTETKGKKTIHLLQCHNPVLL